MSQIDNERENLGTHLCGFCATDTGAGEDHTTHCVARRQLIESGGNPVVVTAVGKRWGDVNGNTYHSAEVWVDGDHVGRESFTYGYESQWEQTALELLIKSGRVPGLTRDHLGYGARRVIEDILGHDYVGSSVDVNRKRDL